MLKQGFFLLFFWLFASCGFYRLNVVNVPLMQQKGDARAGAHVSFTGFEGQAAYAITKHVALMANYANSGERKTKFLANNFINEKHYFEELGGGYFTKNKKGLTSEYYLLLGQGSTSHTLHSQDSTGKVNIENRHASYTRIGLQYNLGKRKNNFEFAISPRIIYINYYNLFDTETDVYKTIPNSFLFADIAFTIHYHLKHHVVISSQATATYPISIKDYGYYDFAPLNYSIGLIWNFTTRHEKAK